MIEAVIHLIVEAKNDGIIIQKILDEMGFKNRIRVRTYPPTKNEAGIGILSKEIESLIGSAKDNLDEQIQQQKLPGCVAVLHDNDRQNRQLDEEPYKVIKAACQKYDVQLVIASDELESWLLADSGVWSWLGKKNRPRNWDHENSPKEKLSDLMWDAHKFRYKGSGQGKAIAKIDGTGHKCSPSMQEAVQKLNAAACVKQMK